MSELSFWKWLVLLNGAIPLGMLGWDAFRGQLGANPVNSAIHTTGFMSLLFLVFSLSVTPLRTVTGWHVLVAFRRTLGLFAFFYAAIHLAIYMVYDRAGSLSSTITEVWSRTYLQVGFASLMIMLPLAVTSTNGMITRLGARRWKRLHRLAYLAAALAAIHFYMLVKADVRLPLVFIGALVLLFAFRAAGLFRSGQRPGGGRRQQQGSAVVPVSPVPKGSLVTSSGTWPAVARPTPPAIGGVPANRKFWTGELQLVHLFDETPEVRTFRWVVPGADRLPFDHAPGQYLTLQLVIDGKRVNRSYTISSSPTRQSYCELSIKREELGLVSRYMHSLQVGDRVRVSAPAGKFVFTGTESDSIVLIAGGVGITPLMSVLRYLTDRAWRGEIYFVIAARTQQHLIFWEEIRWLASRFTNIHLIVTLSAEPAESSWNGRRGPLSGAWLSESIPQLPTRRVHLCGPGGMMDFTQAQLLEQGVPAAQILTEAFVSPGAFSTSAVPESAPSTVAEPIGGEQTDVTTPSEASSAESTATPTLSGGHGTALFARSGKSIPMNPGESILEASERLGVDLPFECRSGICGQCKVKLLSGSVSMDVEDALSPAEKKGGWILGCQAHPHGDVRLDA